MKKVIGYIVALAGVVLVAAPIIPQVASALPIPEGMPDLYVTIAGIALVALGLAFLVNRGGVVDRVRNTRRGKEVPIYEGKEVVGYRRH